MIECHKCSKPATCRIWHDWTHEDEPMCNDHAQEYRDDRAPCEHGYLGPRGRSSGYGCPVCSVGARGVW
jgi:hypothetical protein